VDGQVDGKKGGEERRKERREEGRVMDGWIDEQMEGRVGEWMDLLQGIGKCYYGKGKSGLQGWPAD
jgi:hypothetical protein